MIVSAIKKTLGNRLVKLYTQYYSVRFTTGYYISVSVLSRFHPLYKRSQVC